MSFGTCNGPECPTQGTFSFPPGEPEAETNFFVLKAAWGISKESSFPHPGFVSQFLETARWQRWVAA